MKHLIKKTALAGGKGKKPKPQPATLEPPALGEHQLVTSFSYAEILDLISDGPIAGLVNKKGVILSDEAIFQGIYIDNTSVAATDSNLAVVADKEVVDDGTTTTFDFDQFVGGAFRDLRDQPVNTFSQLYPDASHKLVYAFNDGVENVIDSNVLSQGQGDPQSEEWKLTNANVNLFLNPHTIGQTTEITDPYNALIDLLLDTTATDNTKNYLREVFKEHLGDAFIDDLSVQTFKDFLLQKAGFDGKVRPILLVDASDFSVYQTNSFRDENNEILFNRRIILNSTEVNHMAERIYSFVVPTLSTSNVWDGTVTGFFLIILDSKYIDRSDGWWWSPKPGRTDRHWLGNTRYSWSLSLQDINYLAGIDRCSIVDTSKSSDSKNAQGQKFNYTNVLAEFRKGNEKQAPFKYFNKVYIDKEYNRALLGPFSTKTDSNGGGQVQRIGEGSNMLTESPTVTPIGIPTMSGLFAQGEGSQDNSRLAAGRDYANWDESAITFDEKATSITHVVDNPNVESVFVSLQINSLNDTTTTDVANAQKDGSSLGAGSKYPSILNVRIEVGRIKEDGTEEPAGLKDFQIIALVEAAAIIDIGNPDSATFEEDTYQYISAFNTDYPLAGDVFTPFVLPDARPRQTETVEGKEVRLVPKSDEEETPARRYIRVTKLSTETNSILINKDVSLLKVTEVVPVNLSYPFSSVVGMKLDSRTFSTIPTRTYDCKLKKVKIPTNYLPSYPDGRDKRYFDTQAEFDDTSRDNKRIYIGDWDGQFVWGWTDNPAWILYDLLTSSRYGLGQYIDEDDINKWELYKIGRFCDSVDDDGYFEGVSDGRGGVEPRYSCNILFGEGTKVFDAINIIAALFRGAVFYGGSEINFLDDRLKDPIALFTNSNVKDGIFSYSNHRRDEQFNAVEVVYIDRFDDYKTKIEYIEEEGDIANRGLFKKQVNALGVTSKAMARRVGQHLIYQTIKENQSVSFSAGLETLLCKPGDLVIIEDELKTLVPNFGRVLDIDVVGKNIRIDQQIDTGIYNSGVKVYSPTGIQNTADLDSLVQGRSRLTGFQITGSPNSSFDDFVTDYGFSGYRDGFSGEADEIHPLQKQYAVYTGDSTTTGAIIWFSTDHTGWVFSTGSPYLDDNDFSQFIAEDTGLFHMLDLHAGSKLFTYDAGDPDRRAGTGYSMSGDFVNSAGELSRINQGALNSEIALNSTPQITTLSITGYDNLTYGSRIFIDENDINFAMLSNIPLGSPYRLDRYSATDLIYKIISIKENAPNDYIVIANKYDTGKYALIESDTSIDLGVDTFGYGATHRVNDVVYTLMDKPNITSVITGAGTASGYSITVGWDAVTDATGYGLQLRHPNASIQTDSTNLETYTFDNLISIGRYVIAVNTLGNPNATTRTRFYDSNFCLTGADIFDVLEITAEFDAVHLDDWEIR